MGSAGIRNIAVFGLAFGLCLDFSGSPGTAAEYEQAVEQVAQNAPLLAHSQPAREQAVSDRGDKPPTGKELKRAFFRAVGRDPREQFRRGICTNRFRPDAERNRAATNRIGPHSERKDGTSRCPQDGGWK